MAGEITVTIAPRLPTPTSSTPMGTLKVTLVIQTMITMALATTKKNLMALIQKVVSPVSQAASALM